MYGERMTSGTREIRLVIRGELVSHSPFREKKNLSTFVGNKKISEGEGGGKDVDGKVMYRGTTHLKSL